MSHIVSYGRILLEEEDQFVTLYLTDMSRVTSSEGVLDLLQRNQVVMYALRRWRMREGRRNARHR